MRATAAIEACDVQGRLQRQRLAVAENRLRIVAAASKGQAALVIRESMTRIEFNGAVQVGDRPFVAVSVGMCDAAEQIGRRPRRIDFQRSLGIIQDGGVVALPGVSEGAVQIDVRIMRASAIAAE